MFSKILITVDLNHLNDGKIVVETALAMTQHNPDAEFKVMSVIPPLGSSFVSSFLPRHFDKEIMQEANKRLQKFTNQYFPKEAKVQHILSHGPVYEEINRVAEEIDVDLIIMMAVKQRKSGLSPNTVRVARHSKKPILILR